MSNYKRYLLTYPVEGQIIHKSDSTKRAVKKCYKEYKKLSGDPGGLFAVTDLDSETEYMFKIKGHKIYDMREKYDMEGGYNGIDDQVREIKEIENIFDEDGNSNRKLNNIESNLNKLVRTVDKHIKDGHNNLTPAKIAQKPIIPDDTIDKIIDSPVKTKYKYDPKIVENSLSKLEIFKEIDKYSSNIPNNKSNNEYNTDCIIL